jgi:hypothetical protein
MWLIALVVIVFAAIAPHSFIDYVLVFEAGFFVAAGFAEKYLRR